MTGFGPAMVGSAAEAVRVVSSGDRVYVQGGAATPAALVEALMRRAPSLSGVEITHLHTEGAAPYVAEGMERHFRHNALFIGSNVREAVRWPRRLHPGVPLRDPVSVRARRGATARRSIDSCHAT